MQGILFKKLDMGRWGKYFIALLWTFLLIIALHITDFNPYIILVIWFLGLIADLLVVESGDSLEDARIKEVDQWLRDLSFERQKSLLDIFDYAITWNGKYDGRDFTVKFMQISGEPVRRKDRPYDGAILISTTPINYHEFNLENKERMEMHNFGEIYKWMEKIGMTDDYAQHVSVTDGLDIMAKKKNRVGGSFLFKVDDKKASLILLQHMVTKENLSIAFGAMVNILKHLE